MYAFSREESNTLGNYTKIPGEDLMLITSIDLMQRLRISLQMNLQFLKVTQVISVVYTADRTERQNERDSLLQSPVHSYTKDNNRNKTGRVNRQRYAFEKKNLEDESHKENAANHNPNRRNVERHSGGDESKIDPNMEFQNKWQKESNSGRVQRSALQVEQTITAQRCKGPREQHTMVNQQLEVNNNNGDSLYNSLHSYYKDYVQGDYDRGTENAKPATASTAKWGQEPVRALSKEDSPAEANPKPIAPLATDTFPMLTAYGDDLFYSMENCVPYPLTQSTEESQPAHKQGDSRGREETSLENKRGNSGLNLQEKDTVNYISPVTDNPLLANYCSTFQGSTEAVASSQTLTSGEEKRKTAQGEYNESEDDVPYTPGSLDEEKTEKDSDHLGGKNIPKESPKEKTTREDIPTPPLMRSVDNNYQRSLVLAGDFGSLPPPKSNIVRIFLSSTFSGKSAENYNFAVDNQVQNCWKCGQVIMRSFHPLQI